MKYLIIFFLPIWFCSCMNRKEIRIEGEVSDIPAKTLYLLDAGNRKKIVDSAIYKDGTFKFILKPDIEPFAAQIMYHDANKKPIILMFKNYVKGKGGIAAFWTDYGKTTIKGAWRADATFFHVPKLDISPSKNNDYYYRYIGTNLGQNFETIKRMVEEDPSSYYLLSTVLAYVEDYSPKQLNELVNLFSSELKKSELAKRIYVYIENRYEKGKPFKKFAMTSVDGSVTEAIHRKKVNMIIFWASWCYPCRKEIPQLRELYTRNNHKDFSQVSVSIDKLPIDWEKALKVEQMAWKQYIVNSNDLGKVKAIYNFQAIPLVVFTDNNGMEIARFEGYDEQHMSSYQQLIDSRLK
ncbi:MAG: AhpC/TSA family protein [Flavobacterium sp.]|nr:MAG: AhpC/TSA family protein [Flavobacterium sp.]